VEPGPSGGGEQVRVGVGKDLSGSRGRGGWRTRADDPEEREQAHALLTRAVSNPDWQAASQALDNLMRMLLVLLEAEERLAKRERRATRCNGSWPSSAILT
jgi:hypothetical protein